MRFSFLKLCNCLTEYSQRKNTIQKMTENNICQISKNLIAFNIGKQLKKLHCSESIEELRNNLLPEESFFNRCSLMKRIKTITNFSFIQTDSEIRLVYVGLNNLTYFFNLFNFWWITRKTCLIVFLSICAKKVKKRKKDKK